MTIPFTKAHGAQNDFLLTWASNLPPSPNLPALARSLCHRHTGIGADGWILVDPRPGIRLFNSDGSEAELSGNGTRCAAAFLRRHGFPSAHLEIATGAGPKHLRLLSEAGPATEWEMNMGQPRILHLHFTLPLASGPREATLLDCGNPQCALPVDHFNFDWAALGAEIESHPLFPHRTNVSFFHPRDRHHVEVRFFERGAGVTSSSGTGSTGAAAAALARGLVDNPVTVHTPAGPLPVTQRDSVLFLTGPAVLVADGQFFLPPAVQT